MVEIEMLDGNMVRLRARNGRLVYVEARGAGDAQRWYVHVDGYGREAARSYPCPTREMAEYRVLSELHEAPRHAAEVTSLLVRR